MSLILGYANKDNAIIMSDGRAGENGCVSETYNKTKKINDNIIMGFAGFAEPIDIFLNHTISQMGDKRNEYYIDDFLELVTFLMDDEETKARLKSTFIIIGRNKNNEMYTSIIGNSTGYELQLNLVTTPRVTSIGGKIDGEIIQNIYMKHINNFDTPIKKCMEDTIIEVSKLDPSINSNCFSVTI